jgi:hypothetical protein
MSRVALNQRGIPASFTRRVERTAKVPHQRAKLAALAAQGIVTLPSQKPLKKIRRVKISGRPLSKKIVDERR